MTRQMTKIDYAPASNDTDNDNADAGSATPASVNHTSNTTTTNTRTRRPQPGTNNTTKIFSTQRGFEEATPNLSGVLALQSENLANNLSYDRFKERLEIYIMKNLTGQIRSRRSKRH